MFIVGFVSALIGRRWPVARRADAAVARSATRCASPVLGGDALIRARVLSRYAERPWWLNDRSNVWVRDGVVTLQGVYPGSSRGAAQRLVLDIPGVRRVRDCRVRANEWLSMG